MTNSEIKKLDTLYQRSLLEKHSMSMLGGKATLIHHFTTKAQGISVRWYIPNGIPLTQEQHNKIHGKDRTMLEKMIIQQKGQVWRDDLRRRVTKTIKNLNYQDVENYLLGYAEKYY